MNRLDAGVKRAPFVRGALVVLAAVASPAHAQSSLTLYGVLDEALQFNTNNTNIVNGHNVGGRQWSMNSLSGPHGSRWGFKGSEDLSGGTRAVFTLESGINLNNGQFAQGGTAFGRQAFVGLSNRQYGSLLLGRQYDSVNDYVARLGFGLSGYGGIDHPGDLDNMGHTSHINNTIKYASPTMNGFAFGGTFSPGGVPGSVVENGGFSLGARYANGPLKLGAAYEVFRNPSAVGGALNSNANAVAPDRTTIFGTLNSGYLAGEAPATTWQLAAVAGTWTAGAATFGLAWTNVRYGNIGQLHGATATFNDLETHGIYRFTPTLSGAFEYNYLKGNAVSGDIGDQTYHQVSVIGNYQLSKRTNVYASATVQLASGINSVGTPAVANISGMGDSSNDRQVLLRLGMRHTF
ncbi:porin [Paraburkholderia sp. ZP32-5]|uniref:porin n=1 Tax=Paraburkholderia sp. ZP32-5 TaxID=2883245 RepID=UPI001F212857|nr:porin [Paraburkholderia sp. ZP32-5]